MKVAMNEYLLHLESGRIVKQNAATPEQAILQANRATGEMVKECGLIGVVPVVSVESTFDRLRRGGQNV